MRAVILAALALAACRYDPSGVLAADGVPDAATAATGDAPATALDAAPSTPRDAAAPDAAPPDAAPPPACELLDGGDPDCRDADCPACGPLSACCDDGTCALVGLCV